ncbi:MAG: HAD family hydrolase [Proteobacteria bacterium]|nr:HAD family hydrolase [Pseudomonadota bacterium]MDA0994249.1 HAD family hydrolase [Pseudomonadota bacterium]
MHRIRAITLDLDNTLWEIDPVIHRAEASLWKWLSENYPRIPETFSPEDAVVLREVMIEKYWKHKSHDFRFLRKKVLETLAQEVGYSPDLVEPAFRIFDEARNDVELYPDVLPDLERLFAKFTVIAVTNGNANLQMIGISHLFHHVVTAVGAGAAKPARRIFDIAVQKAGVSPQEILHVGDHPETDVAGGREAGLRTAWINRTNAIWPEHLEEPDLTVSTLSEIREILEKASG